MVCFLDTDGTRDTPVATYPLWVKANSGRSIPVVQAKAFGRYIGRLVLEFDDEGNLVDLEGWPILMGDWASEKVVPMDSAIQSEVKE